MTDHPITSHRLTDPWLLAVWPGMGNVALGAGGYLIDKLLPQPLFTVPTDGFFDLGQVQVRDGLIGAARLPENRFYAWKNPGGGRDLVIFVGEAQPTTRGYAFCEALLRTAEGLGVKRVFTFASIVTPQHPTSPSRVFTVATTTELLQDVRRLEPGTGVLTEGAISGLNGTLLAAAAARGLEGVGLLAEVPQVAANVPYLKASHAVLTVFSRLTGMSVDLDELAVQAGRVEKGLLQLIQQLGALAAQTQQGVTEGSGATKHEQDDASDDDEDEPDLRAARAQDAAAAREPDDEDEDEGEAPTGKLDPSTVAHIEQLFLKAADDRAQAMRLKELLDRHGAFKTYEDRFLNLFLKRESETPPT